MKRLQKELEEILNERVQRGKIKIKTVTRDTYLNDAERVLEALVFTKETKDIQQTMRAYGLKGDYRTAFRQLKSIVQNFRPKRKS